MFSNVIEWNVNWIWLVNELNVFCAKSISDPITQLTENERTKFDQCRRKMMHNLILISTASIWSRFINRMIDVQSMNYD